MGYAVGFINGQSEAIPLIQNPKSKISKLGRHFMLFYVLSKRR
ncbi:hypothetical protein D1AOALGA4SA_962 [Olavius algarvensis Delta 1 endosymbiont]|nr:hypothetical protein D1AOALGA4SA_962 [Olavius algarvensis Delta 1 endosymbiont]